MDKEYLMLRTEIEENLKKQDQTFSIIISILGLSNIFLNTSENIAFLFLILFLSTLLQLRLLEYRNIVYYISTYMVVFLEKNSSFRWETHLNQFKEGGYELENINTINKIVNKMVVSFGRIIKHFSILALSIFLIFRIVISIQSIECSLYIKLIIYVGATTFLIFNILYTYTLCTDKIKYKMYLNRWEKIKKP